MLGMQISSELNIIALFLDLTTYLEVACNLLARLLVFLIVLTILESILDSLMKTTDYELLFYIRKCYDNQDDDESSPLRK